MAATRRANTGSVHRHGPSAWVFKTLMVVGSTAIAISTVASSAIYLVFGVSYALIVPIVLAGATLFAMWLRGPATLLRCLRRLAPVAAFALITLAVAAIASFRMGVGMAGVLRYSLGPASWFSAAVIGYIAGRSKLVPVILAAAVASVSALIGVLSFSEAFGASNPVGRWYVAWLTATGAWAPSTGEYFRAVGLDLDPNTFGLIGAVAMVALVCIDGPGWLRALGGAASGSVLALSGSRTAITATVVALMVVALLQWVTRPASESRHRIGAAAAVAGLLTAGLLFSVAVTAEAGPAATLQRLGIGAAVLSTDGGAAGLSAADLATSGRTQIWTEALTWYSRYPLGAFVAPESLVGKSIHNEYLERLLFGGPLLLASFLALLTWLAVRMRPAAAPTLGPALCTVYAVSAFTLGPSLLPAFLGLAFYLVGWGRAQPENSRTTTRNAGADAARSVAGKGNRRHKPVRSA